MRSKIIIIAVIALMVVAGFTFGFYLGQNKGLPGNVGGKSKAELQKIVDNVYAPPQEIFALSGKIKGIYGATINLEINDPNDYLPHLDGSPKKTETRFASITSATIYTLVDQTRRDKNGIPIVTSFKFADLKIGDYVLVKSASNIRDAEKFDVTSVEMVKY